jgi:hypothetical protein
MKDILQHTSRRCTHDGWALSHRGGIPWRSTVCTTREEARQMKREIEERDPDMFRRLDVVKVKVSVASA